MVLLTVALAGIASWLGLAVLRPLAVTLNLVDLPNGRKMHVGAVPLIGGLAIFSGLTLAWGLMMPMAHGYGVFFVCAFMLVMVGALDDAMDLSARSRLIAQILTAITLVLGTGQYLQSLGDLAGFGAIDLTLFIGWAVTTAAVIGATNAFNMVDGIDGLAGTLGLVALAALSLLFYAHPAHGPDLVFATGLCVALIPYLLINLGLIPGHQKVFLGDAGSIFLGFAIIWLLVRASQGDEPVMRPVTALWLVAVPLMDMVSIMARRLRRGQSVMAADRQHLHHMLLRAGCTQGQALACISAAAVLLSIFGLAGESFAVPEWLMFGSFLAVFVIYDFAASQFWRSSVVYRSASEDK
ncbi:UDP-GlcNAc:undecaprenyl-phosphate GlcNAc-1-phosphate transferase [Marinobacter pelagius]|uniref:Undecaprenyl-phosphate alpha-N-acetylglucosaminyl 1-phosphate transferase n=1 Tax=Marinobacter pelagius TaxID=379482 RepID=A0A366GDM4_9GAMM|nr:UDP-N-acetylglucosamine--undecaprenyl-phosphate N-acetylglucosaminephosphotransferase [Marinobacter pelagius]RBP25043.1 UDP-GlcNAc:undecaprenyl-phosphate GlcNAc-1-phosphate transferase [Marinobacter pelagius]